MIGNIQIWCLVIVTVVGLAHGYGVCSLPKITGPCKAYIPSYFFNIKSGLCERFVYGGCQGNANRFKTLNECRHTCGGVCSLPKITGPCEAYIPSYFFNIKSGLCERFAYGGCQGNENRFKTLEQCRDSCGGVCSLPKITGPCKAYIPSYFFNIKSGLCERFVYGGCQGNGNRFKTREQCRDSCGGVCSLPKITGPCKAYIPSYFFNIKSGLCEKFVYGGCRGNANRFTTLKQCQDTCGFSLCRLPKVVGPCRARIRRFFYNSKTGKCQRFYYGGCRGNANNFKTKSKCQRQCP